MLAALARMERQVVGERVKARHRLNKQRGKLPGPARKVKITDTEVKRRHDAGESLKQIAQSAGCSTMLLSARLRKA
jgi:DNA invertase Pin-like site-specific DNA recombinase